MTKYDIKKYQKETWDSPSLNYYTFKGFLSGRQHTEMMDIFHILIIYLIIYYFDYKKSASQKNQWMNLKCTLFLNKVTC